MKQTNQLLLPSQFNPVPLSPTSTFPHHASALDHLNRDSRALADDISTQLGLYMRGLGSNMSSKRLEIYATWRDLGPPMGLRLAEGLTASPLVRPIIDVFLWTLTVGVSCPV